jgi:hypothetical protein
MFNKLILKFILVFFLILKNCIEIFQNDMIDNWLIRFYMSNINQYCIKDNDFELRRN